MTGSVASEAGGSRGIDGVERVRALLSEALEIVDAEEMPPEIGARLSDVLSALEEYRTLGSSG
jgi:hypothetical protein